LDKAAVAAELSRLHRAGALKRIRKGLYYRPRASAFGPTSPDPVVLADTILESRGEKSYPAGIGAYNSLGLTTQMSPIVSRAVDRRVAPYNISKLDLRVVRRPLDKQKDISADERVILDALRDADRLPGASTADVIDRIENMLRSGVIDYARLAKFAEAEPPRVRALLGAIGDDLLRDPTVDTVPVSSVNTLRHGLNRLTTFKIHGAWAALPHVAKAWRIK
jgi:hypothetical protein